MPVVSYGGLLWRVLFVCLASDCLQVCLAGWFALVYVGVCCYVWLFAARTCLVVGLFALACAGLTVCFGGEFGCFACLHDCLCDWLRYVVLRRGVVFGCLV